MPLDGTSFPAKHLCHSRSQDKGLLRSGGKEGRRRRDLEMGLEGFAVSYPFGLSPSPEKGQ